MTDEAMTPELFEKLNEEAKNLTLRFLEVIEGHDNRAVLPALCNLVCGLIRMQGSGFELVVEGVLSSWENETAMSLIERAVGLTPVASGQPAS